MTKPAREGERASAVVLLSAGLDSTFNLFKAVSCFDVKAALTFDYGQLAAGKELERAEALAKFFKVPHQIVWLPWFRRFTQTALIGGAGVPFGNEIDLDNLERSRTTAKAVWVPNRNGIFLNVAAGFAEGLNATFVVPGFNKEEAQTFSDNSAEFLKVLDASFALSTATQVKTYCFSTEMTKSEIVAEAKKEARFPFAQLWPCYRDLDEWCGECESCQRFRRAGSSNGLDFEVLRKGPPP
ncbi:MAG: 7-cyano-7-deazaguanine synthase [Bdellovibrionales bacterium]